MKIRFRALSWSCTILLSVGCTEDPAEQQPDTEQTALAEKRNDSLVERTNDTADEKVELPADMPADMAVYPDAVVETAYSAPAIVSLKLETEDDLTTVADFYEQTLTELGWEIKTSNRTETNAAFQSFKGKRYQNVNMIASAERTVIVIRCLRE